MTGRTVDFAIERVDVDVDDPMQTSTWCSLVDLPPAGKFRADRGRLDDLFQGLGWRV